MKTQRTQTFRILIVLFFCTFSSLTNGQGVYPNDINISFPNGEPKDSLTFYFPTSINIYDTTYQTGLDSFELKWYSNSIRPTKEPILYNYYQGHDIYRFTWLRSFNPPIVITLHKDGNKVWVRAVKLDCIPRDIYRGYIKFDPPKKHRKKNIDTTTTTSDYKTDSVEHIVRIAKIQKDETKIISIQEWNNFEKLIAQCNFWHMTPTVDAMGFDGSQWIIEGHQKNNYWIVDRWAPKDNYRKCGEYLIKLSGLKVDVY